MNEVAHGTRGEETEKTAIYRIGGLDCYSCGLSMISAFKRNEKIKEATLNFVTQQIRVRYIGDDATLDEVEKEIVRSGYRPMLQKR